MFLFFSVFVYYYFFVHRRVAQINRQAFFQGGGAGE